MLSSISYEQCEINYLLSLSNFSILATLSADIDKQSAAKPHIFTWWFILGDFYRAWSIWTGRKPLLKSCIFYTVQPHSLSCHVFLRLSQWLQWNLNNKKPLCRLYHTAYPDWLIMTKSNIFSRSFPLALRFTQPQCTCQANVNCHGNVACCIIWKHQLHVLFLT